MYYPANSAQFHFAQNVPPPSPAYSLCGFCKAVSYFLCNFRITSSKNRFDASVKLLLLDFSPGASSFLRYWRTAFWREGRGSFWYSLVSIQTIDWQKRRFCLRCTYLKVQVLFWQSYSFLCSHSWLNFICCTRLQNYLVQFIGTVPQDFRLQVFFMMQFPSSPWVSH